MSITPEDVKGKRETIADLHEQIAAQKVARSEINIETERVLESQKLDIEIARLKETLEDEETATKVAKANAEKVIGVPEEAAPVVVVDDAPSVVQVDEAPVVQPEAPTQAAPAPRAQKSDSVKSPNTGKEF